MRTDGSNIQPSAFAGKEACEAFMPGKQEEEQPQWYRSSPGQEIWTAKIHVE